MKPTTHKATTAVTTKGCLARGLFAGLSLMFLVASFETNTHLDIGETTADVDLPAGGYTAKKKDEDGDA